MLPIELLVVCHEPLTLKLQWRWFLGTWKPVSSSVTNFVWRIIWKLARRLVVNEGFSPGLPIVMLSGLVSS